MRARVLVVEDSATHAAVATHALLPEGWRVEVATTIERALALLARRSYDLVLLDWHVRDRTGQDVLEAYPDAPILIWTARECAGSEPWCVSKDADTATLLGRCRDVIRRHRSRHETRRHELTQDLTREIMRRAEARDA